MMKRDLDTGAGVNLFSSLPDMSLCSWTEHFPVYEIKNFTIMMVSYWTEKNVAIFTV